jgi:hypothetical protein
LSDSGLEQNRKAGRVETRDLTQTWSRPPRSTPNRTTSTPQQRIILSLRRRPSQHLTSDLYLGVSSLFLPSPRPSRRARTRLTLFSPTLLDYTPTYKSQPTTVRRYHKLNRPHPSSPLDSAGQNDRPTDQRARLLLDNMSFYRREDCVPCSNDPVCNCASDERCILTSR